MKILSYVASVVIVIAMAVGLVTCDEPEDPKPEITALNPTSGAIGDKVTITGQNLSAIEKINFGTVSTTPASTSATQVITAVPEGVTPGDLKVSVSAAGKSSGTLDFKVLPSVPEITSLTPDRGSIGMEVSVKGKYLSNALNVTFGTKQITTFSLNDDDELKVNVPAELGVGAFNVTVTTAGGTSEPETFTIVPKPAISSFTPEVGPAGRVIQISGSNFEEVTKVFFGAGEATFVYKNATLIEATVPISATTGKIKVVTPGGEALSTKDFTVKDAPTITDFNPKSAVAGTAVTIDGSGFETGAVVKFGNGTATDVTVVNGAKITAKVPATATTGKITVTTAAGTGESSTNFEVIGAPEVLDNFSPQKGPVGTSVVINGKNFIGVTAVKFNNTAVAAANYTVNSDIKITAKVPTGALTGKISVTTPAGTGQSTTNFTVEVPPQVNSFNPPNGLPGSTVVITGTNFASITSVTINNIEVGVANFTVDSETQITAKVPANATSGKIKVTNAAGSHTSTATFYITPVISTINPTQASAGTPITITGTNLENAKVKFNVIEMTPTSNSSTTIVVDSPPSTTGAMNVTVVNLGGTSNAKTFTGTPPVIVDEVVATQNIVNQLILLEGSNLLGASKVWFNNTQASVLTVTNKVVTATIPASLAVGSYTVRVETNKGTSNSKTFQVLSTQNANTSGATLVTGSTVTSYSAPVAPPVANFWLNSNNVSVESFFIFNEVDNAFEIQFTNSDATYFGTGTFDNTVVDGVYNNYIEFTVSVNGTDYRYVGTWTPYSVEDDGFGGTQCMANLTMIETKSGKQLKLKVQFGTECP
jgi:large repetitive protein